MLEKMLSFITKKKFGLSDILSGLKVYNLNSFTKRKLSYLIKNDIAGTNYLIDLIQDKKRVKEIPIGFAKRKFGKSKFYSSIRNKLKIIFLIFKINYIF